MLKAVAGNVARYETNPVTGGIEVSKVVCGRSAAELAAAPTATDIAFGDSTVFYDIADPTKRYAMKADHSAFVAIGGTSSSSNVPYSLSKGGVPIGIAPSGTMAANGAVTLGTALNVTYSGGIWLYFPAGAVFAGSAAGFYWCVMSSTTVGTVYQNTYTPGTNGFDIPASPTAVVDAGPGAYTGVTSEVTAVSVTLPANSLGLNGALRIFGGFTNNNSAGNKTADFKLDGTSAGSFIFSTNVTAGVVRVIQNRGKANFQVTGRTNQLNHEGYNATGNIGQLSVDTTINKPVTLTLDTAVATDFVVLENYHIEVRP